MNNSKRIIFTVTNDLSYDQRMIRICTSLANAGFSVTLAGRRLSASIPLSSAVFEQKRLGCWFTRGKLFYFEFNLRLFFFLLFRKTDVICAIDLDTIVACYLVSALKRVPRIYDAHELFCEMKEIVTRPPVYRFWKLIERLIVPRFINGYTVNQPIADEFKKMYGVNYSLIRNIPLLTKLKIPVKVEKYILYQGAVNEGRSFETLVPAMLQVNAKLIICGDGNFIQQAKALVSQLKLKDKIIFKGLIEPKELRHFTLHAWAGITLFEGVGLSNYYSLANRFFDYLHAGIPQLCVNFPVYADINNRLPVAVLIDKLDPDTIATALNRLLNDRFLYDALQQNCLKLRQDMNWQEEEKRLIAFYQNKISAVG